MTWKLIGNIRGPKGKRGAPGESIPGVPGVGIRGPMGPFPRHEWDRSRIRFEVAPNEWGPWVDLQGPHGQRLEYISPPARTRRGGGGIRTEVSTITEPSAQGNQYVAFGEHTGPASYATGGMQIDLSATFSQINHFEIATKTIDSDLPLSHYHYAVNSPSDGIVTVGIIKRQYERASATGFSEGQPSGVTMLTTSGGTSSSEAAHTHAFDHDHGSFASGINQNNGGGQVLLNALGPNLEQHTHTLDLPTLTGTSGAGTSHNHTDNTIYQHQHGVTHAATDFTHPELAAGTNLSDAVWYWMATGIAA